LALPKLTLSVGTVPYPGYRLTRFLGRGGLGEVWKATRPNGTFAALKFLASDCQFASSQEIRALHALRELKHPNMIRMEHIWSCPGFLVIVMELADGSLHDLLDIYATELNAPIPPDHVCGFLSQAAAALDFLNERQHMVNDQRVAFRHCDVKPSNLLVVGNTVKVSDFSLAVQTTAPIWHSRCAGTIAYAAPETFQGWLSDRTDQYCLAATYYHLRTGNLPFPDQPPNFDKKYVRPLPDLKPFVEPERAVLTRAFAHVPQDRWPSCSEFMKRLSRCFEPEKAASPWAAAGSP
jgi:serine/threonine protein kinase